jgi:hypothetical protein
VKTPDGAQLRVSNCRYQAAGINLPASTKAPLGCRPADRQKNSQKATEKTTEKQTGFHPETERECSSSGPSGAIAILRSSSIRRLEFYYI